MPAARSVPERTGEEETTNAMDDRTIELNDGGAIPLLGFGTWPLAGREAYEAVTTALEVGYRHLDTATAYGNEAEVGAALRDSALARGDVFVTTKCPPEHVARARATLESSLSDFGTDYVDLWLVHWPPGGKARPDVWRVFVAAHEEGLARSIGVSNYSAEQLDELIEATGVTPAVNQIPWSPSLYDERLVAEHHERGVVLEGYSPLKRAHLGAAVLVEIAAAHEVTPAQVVLRWHLEHRFVVIPKSARRERIEENFDLLGFSLSAEEIERLDRLGAAA
jgi:diketogulonate reductase-like aldo/keto reductase